MENKHFIIIAIVSISLLGMSCKKNFLDPNPTDRIAETAVWKSKALMEAYLNNNYNDISDGYYVKDAFDDAQLVASVCDEAVSHYESYEGRNVLVDGTLSADNVENHRMLRLRWANNYYFVNKANIFLKNITDVTVLDATTKKKFTAEMKTLRAFRYFTLLRKWGGVPLISIPFELGADYTIPARATIAATISFIQKDLDEAIPDLPRYDDAGGRLSRGVALGLKSRLLLYAASPLYSTSNDIAKWQAAADAAKQTIDLSDHELEPTLEGLRTIFYNGEINSREIMFRQQTNINTGSGSSFTPGNGDNPFFRMVNFEMNFIQNGGPIGIKGLSYFTPIQQFVDAYEMANGKPILDPTSGYNDQQPYLNRDPRFYKFVYHHGSVLNNRIMDFSTTGLDRQVFTYYSNPTGYNMRKFVDETHISADGLSYTITANQTKMMPWIHMRYAEILLNYAEALNEVNNTAGAYDALNKIRRRASMPDLPVGLSQSQMRDRIRNERRVELAFEEHRYYDVRRWKIADVTENITLKSVVIVKGGGPGGSDRYTYPTADGNDITTTRRFLNHQYFWPITIAELQASPALAQNPGY